MKRILLILFLFLAAGQGVTGQSRLTGRVVAVADGDTFTMLISGRKQLKIRLHGVDCPEKNQDFGTRAKTFTADHVFGKTVTIWVRDTDRYGRTVALVILPSGKVLQEELLKNGLAWHYKTYDQTPRFASLEARARADRIGLWSIKNPVAPWEFRKNRRNRAAATPVRKVKAGSLPVACGARTAAGGSCRRIVDGGGYCFQHR